MCLAAPSTGGRLSVWGEGGVSLWLCLFVRHINNLLKRSRPPLLHLLMISLAQIRLIEHSGTFSECRCSLLRPVGGAFFCCFFNLHSSLDVEQNYLEGFGAAEFIMADSFFLCKKLQIQILFWLPEAVGT